MYVCMYVYIYIYTNTHTHTHVSVRTAQYTHFLCVIKRSQLLLHMDENLWLYWDPYAAQKYEIFVYSSSRIQNFWILNLVLHKLATER